MAEAKFLVVRLGSLGDIVHTFPAVAALRETFPDGKIVWLTDQRWRALVESTGLADEIWDLDTRSLQSVNSMRKKAWNEEFLASIDYQGLWKSAAIPFLARIPKRIGFSSETVREFGVPILYSDKVRVSGTHIAEQNGELSLRAGAQKAIGKFSLIVPEPAKRDVAKVLNSEDVREYFVLSPGGGWISKCWPAERYGQLALRLHAEHGMKSVINFGPGEEGLAERVVAAAGEAKPFRYSAEFGGLMALLQRAKAVVAGDTGPLHLADALGARVVAIFGPTDPARNGPFFGKKTVLRAKNVESTYKRHDMPHPSLLEIGVDEVLNALREANAFS
jgi:heptosyltransferase I